jgi:hypothetical protein
MLSRRTLLGIVTSPLASPTGARSRRDFDYEDDNWVLSEPQYQPPSEARRDRTSKLHFNFKNAFNAALIEEQRNGDQESKRHNKPFAEGDKARTM